MADIVLPATMFMEHDDLYYGGGHQHISVGAKLIEPPGECRSNHEVLQGLGRRLNAVHPGFEMTRARTDRCDAEEERPWRHRDAGSRSVARPAAGFPHLALPRRLRACGQQIPFQGRLGAIRRSASRAWARGQQMPSLPDHWTVIEEADAAHPFRLATSPSRSFLNTSFNETPSSQRARGRARSVMIHPGRRRRARRSPTATPSRSATSARRDHADRKIVRRPAPRRADRGIDPAEQGPYRRPRHQHADRRRRGRADRRRGVPRQQGLGEEGGASDCAQELNRACSPPPSCR